MSITKAVTYYDAHRYATDAADTAVPNVRELESKYMAVEAEYSAAESVYQAALQLWINSDKEPCEDSPEEVLSDALWAICEKLNKQLEELRQGLSEWTAAYEEAHKQFLAEHPDITDEY